MARAVLVLLFALIPLGCASDESAPDGPPAVDEERLRWEAGRAAIEQMSGYLQAEWKLGAPAPGNARLLAGADQVVFLPPLEWPAFPSNDVPGYAVLAGPEQAVRVSSYVLTSDDGSSVKVRVDRATVGSGWLVLKPGPNRGELTLISEEAEFASLVLSARSGIPGAGITEDGRLLPKPHALPGD